MNLYTVLFPNITLCGKQFFYLITVLITETREAY